MWAEFFRAAGGQHAKVAELQQALDAWVADYNTAWRHDRAHELGAFANPKGRPRRKNSAIGNVV